MRLAQLLASKAFEKPKLEWYVLGKNGKAAGEVSMEVVAEKMASAEEEVRPSPKLSPEP